MELQSNSARRHAGRIALLLCGTALLAAPMSVLAQDGSKAAQDAATASSNDIIVTAQKRSENMMKVPVAISAFTGDMLQKSGVQGVQGLSVATPAIVYPSTGAYAQPYIRGVGSRLLQNGLDPSVATYIDNRYISRQSAVVFDFADVERVEVLKGPQGALFGRNASAGAIRVLTKEVDKDVEGYVKAGYGNYNQWTLSGAVNAPLTENFGMRISGMTSQRDGYVKNLVPTGRKELDDRDFNAVRIKTRWTPGDVLDAKLSLSYWSQNDNAGNDTVALGPPEYTTGLANGGITGTDSKHVATALTGANKKEEFAGELNLGFDLGGVQLQSISTYARLDNRLTFDGDGTSSRLVDATVFENTRTFSQELQLSSQGTNTIDWIAGAFYFHDDTSFDTIIDVGPRIVSNGLQRVKTESYAAFGQATWHISPMLSFVVGGRYSHDRKDVSSVASPHRGAVTLPATPDEDSKAWSKFTPSATLQYDFGNTLVYAKFARGYKSGGFNYPVQNQPVLSPEILDMYELGLKGNFFDRAVRTTLSAYYYDYSDLQVTRAAAEGVGVIVTTENAANAELYGLDADVTWSVTPAFTLTGAASWQHSQYKDYLASAKVYRSVLPGGTARGMVDVGFDADGHRLLRAPKFSAYAAANYDLPVGSGVVPINLSYAYKGSYDFDFVYDPPNATRTGTTRALRQKAYSIVNGRIGYRPESDRWSVSAWVNNLLKEKYFDDVVAAGVGIRGSYGAPRTYGVEFQFNF
ncbi:TonB-dependent receptor [Novosphingobium resinovorum]|uniref:TonB-dependent receptor n=1 Tax=Novosphingobium resinovorum TaxID=158500 RepID=UPI002ED59FAE|nr:TonB-dependent receptor [Novosphingobium resinovorum]